MNKVFEKKFKSTQENLPLIEEFILTIVKEINFPEDKIHNVELATAEASANCVLHGNENDGSKVVIIKITIHDDLLEISFTDQGEGFIPEDVPDPTKPENILKGSGRGLHIMKSLTDDLNYHFTDSGTELILSFKF